jgi:PAS domain S-box-containing protein
MSNATDRLVAPEQNPTDPCLPLTDRQLAALFAGVADAIFIEVLKSRQIVYWSAGATSLFAYSSAEVLQQSSARLLAEENASDKADEALSAELLKARTWRGLRRYRRADGAVFNADVTMSLLPAANGDCAVVTVQPRTDGQKSNSLSTPHSADAQEPAEQPRQSDSERKQGQQAILRNIDYALISTDTDGNIREWNREALRLFGYERGEIFGRHVSLICAEGAARALQKTFQDAREQGTSRYYQWMLRKDGKRFYARVVAFALWDDTRVQGFLLLFSDESSEPSLRQILREKEQMAAIGTAASMLAHEIGNPLNGISATVQLLEHFLTRDTPPGAQSMLSSVHDLKSEVRRLTALLNEFKNIAWPQKLAFSPVDVPRLIRHLVGVIEKRSTHQNVEVSVECQTALPLLNGDDDKLKQALLQVFDNALDAMPHGGKLDIKAYQNEQAICIDVIDTGVGIPKNLKVFDLFSTTKPDAVGLGLFMVQQIVLAHGGAITYSSTPGQGTTFHVTFMLRPPSDPRADFIEII